MEALIVWLFSSALAYRLSRMVALEEGPFRLFDLFREGATRLFGLDSWITRGVNCPLCVSVWVSLGLTIVLRGDWFQWGATAGLACYLLATERT
jgi:hypothetical protein